MSIEQNKEIVRRYFEEVVNAWNPEWLDELVTAELRGPPGAGPEDAA